MPGSTDVWLAVANAIKERFKNSYFFCYFKNKHLKPLKTQKNNVKIDEEMKEKNYVKKMLKI